MTQLRELYRCEVCGNIVEIVHEGMPALVCCGKPMVKLQAKTKDKGEEKHVPVIECPDKVKAGEVVKVSVGLGKAVEHPNTTAHHISNVQVFFSPDDDKFTYELGRFEFNAHGESVEGADAGPVYTHHEVTLAFKTSKAGTLHAVSLCNIHGLWESWKRVEVE